MDDLAAFLRARLDKDAEAARLAEAVGPSPWCESVEDGSYTNQRSDLDGVGLVRAADSVGLWDREQSCTLSMAGVTATHVAHHDPARVLAEVEAKRRIVARYEEAVAEAAQEDRLAAATWRPVVMILEPVLRDLAQVHAEHPDYRQEWRS